MDDFVILAASEAEADAALIEVNQWMAHHQLELHAS
nr:hypothetical protein [Methylomarinum sp. Ch1-1]MDP4521935.1 hypothetical protein [Methylomarinum sp. Ch1-1]